MYSATKLSILFAALAAATVHAQDLDTSITVDAPIDYDPAPDAPAVSPPAPFASFLPGVPVDSCLPVTVTSIFAPTSILTVVETVPATPDIDEKRRRDYHPHAIVARQAANAKPTTTVVKTITSATTSTSTTVTTLVRTATAKVTSTALTTVTVTGKPVVRTSTVVSTSTKTVSSTSYVSSTSTATASSTRTVTAPTVTTTVGAAPAA